MIKLKKILLALLIVLISGFVVLRAPSAFSESFEYGFPSLIDFGVEEIEYSFEVQSPANQDLTILISLYPDEVQIVPVAAFILKGMSMRFTVKLKRSQLEPGYYDKTIVFLVNTVETPVRFKAIVKPSPYPSVSPKQIEFGTDRTRTLVIRNVGGIPLVPLNFQVNEKPLWLEISPISGSADINGTNLNVSVIDSQLTPGLNRGIIRISTNSQEIPLVEISVSAVSQPSSVPILEITPLLLDFGDLTEESFVLIKNKGGGFLSGRFEFPLSCQFSSSIYISHMIFGPIQAGQALTVTIRVRRGGLSAGVYYTPLLVFSNGGNASIDLRFTVKRPPQPRLSIYPGVLDFRNSNSNQLSFNIYNIGETGSLLSWKINSIPSGIIFSPASGILLANTSTKVDVIVTSDLPAGEHAFNILVESNGGNAYLQVFIRKIAPPKIKISPANLNFGEKEEVEIKVENILQVPSLYQENLQVKLTFPSWLTIISEFKEIIKPGEALLVRFKLNRSYFDKPGSYTDSVKIQTNDPSQKTIVLPVLVTIRPPILSVTPQILNFGENLTTLQFFVTNAGEAILKGKISSLDKWITVDQQSFSLRKGEILIVNVSINRKLLKPGGYRGDIAIVSLEGATYNLPIYLEIPAPKPKLYVEIEQFNFGKELDTVSFTIANTGEKDSILRWNTKLDTNVLLISEKEGELAGGEYKLITVKLNRSLLAVGEWKFALEIITDTERKIIYFFATKEYPPLIVPETIKINLDENNSFAIDIPEDLPIVNVEIPSFMNYLKEFGKLKFVIKNRGEVPYGVTNWEIKITTPKETKNIIVTIYNPVKIQFFIEKDIYFLNGELGFTYPPVVKNGRTFLPIRTIAEALKLIIEYNSENKVITVRDRNTNSYIILQIGSPIINLNGSIIVIEHLPFIVDGRTMVPIRFIAECFGFKVSWIPNLNSVILVK